MTTIDGTTTTQLFMSGGQLILLVITIMGIGALMGRYWFPKT